MNRPEGFPSGNISNNNELLDFVFASMEKCDRIVIANTMKRQINRIYKWFVVRLTEDLRKKGREGKGEREVTSIHFFCKKKTSLASSSSAAAVILSVRKDYTPLRVNNSVENPSHLERITTLTGTLKGLYLCFLSKPRWASFIGKPSKQSIWRDNNYAN